MGNKEYTLSYLPFFEQDLTQVASYIANVLHNPEAALRLIGDVEEAIKERLGNAESFEPYPSTTGRPHPYYRIYVRNYTVYYVVIDNVMEVRRLLYGGRKQEENLLE
ncbi:MAG TPA: plasmid stabilization protein [Clostridiales bacterium]|nr:plasmid stabilization protein [Clostridiales bacterium]